MITNPRAAGRGLLSPATEAAILAMAIVTALYLGRSVFVPLALAVLLSFVLSPPVVWLRKLQLPRALAVAAVVLVTVVTVGALGLGLARQVGDLGKDLPRYESTLREKLKTLRTGFAQSSLVDRATATLNELSKELEPRAGIDAVPATGAARDGGRPIRVEVYPPTEPPLDRLQRIVAALLHPLTTTGVVLLLVIFILLQREDIRDRVIRLAGAGDIETTTTALNDAAERLSRLFLVQSAMNVGYGIVITLALWAIGVPSPVLWGVLAALMRFVPYIGAILAAVFPLLLAAAVDPGWTMALSVLALYLVIEHAVGHFLEPWVQGQSTGLSPLAIVVSAIFWTALWGPIGLLLATPLTMCLVVLGRHVEGLTFLDVVLGDKPALAPPEIFYQRLLAGSTVEAAEQAEEIITESSLVGYFDAVAIPGLQLATGDRLRGAIDDARMRELLEGTQRLLDDVAQPEPATSRLPATNAKLAENAKRPQSAPMIEHLDTAWLGPAPGVLCVGIRTPLDTAAAAMLAQAIRQAGISAQAITVTQLAEIDLSRVKLVWLSSLDAAHSNAHVRYSVRRLRRLAPGLAFCGAFWDGHDAKAMLEQALIASVASTVEAAVQSTIERAQKAGTATEPPASSDDRPPLPVAAGVATR